MARYAHVTDFSVVVDCFSRQEVSRLLGISNKTLSRWLSGKARIPWIAYQLLYDRSRYGLAERDSMERFERQALLGERRALLERVKSLEAELTRITALVDWGCANDPSYELKQA